MASKKKKDAKASTAKLLLDSARKRRQSRAIRRAKASEQHHKNLNNSILAVAEAFLQVPRQEPEGSCLGQVTEIIIRKEG